MVATAKGDCRQRGMPAAAALLSDEAHAWELRRHPRLGEATKPT